MSRCSHTGIVAARRYVRAVRFPRRRLAALGVALVASTVLASATRVGAASRVPGRVVSAIDGDTITVRLDGAVVTIRLAGIDSPETKDPRVTVQCFGKEAAARTATLVRGAAVSVETDLTQPRPDRYGRLVAFVYLPDGTMLNERLLAEGFATEYAGALPHPYTDRFHAAAVAARRAGRGLWAADTCAGVTVEPLAAATDPTAAAPCAVGQVKGNRRSHIAHAPGQLFYAKTRASVTCFDTVAAAVRAGFRPARQ